MLNYMKEVFNAYKQQPKFLFGFHGELSHDSYNDIGVVDEDLRNWLRDLNEFGHLNNTVLILMSDHGHRLVYRVLPEIKFSNCNRCQLRDDGRNFSFKDSQKFVTPCRVNKKKDCHSFPLPFPLV